MKVEALNCPNCGAGVESDRTLCQFCKSRLKTVACTSCFGLMFEGTRFCGHCGAIAAPVMVSLDDETGECPRCHSPLEILEIGETRIRGCNRCDGLWLDVSTFENVCADRERQSAVLGFLQKRTVSGDFKTKIAYVPCPDCGQLMNRNNFAKASGVIVDICKQHGIWFDADELPAIVEFIRRGGMDIARQREKHEIEEERGRLRDEQRKMGIENRRIGDIEAFSHDTNAGITRFIGKLFE
jgi:Zn-finger nucleic acid-binding protein